MYDKKTIQSFINTDSKNLSFLKDKSIQLIVTSPPYPMIEMWEDSFSSQGMTDFNNYNAAYEKMHELLNKVWEECDRVLADSGFVCINIGDAVKNCDGKFKLFANHTKIVDFFIEKNYCMLPSIIWNKPANSPNKFMGSGMLPAGAYVTLEHEYILIFRKGAKREFATKEEKNKRQKSAYFWEERNIWFSNIWDIKGLNQKIYTADRKRSGAFPFEVPYRLINMYSVKEDTVLDPFAGTGTTILAAAASERNGIGIEISNQIYNLGLKNMEQSLSFINDIVDKRIKNHNDFISSLTQEKKDKCYINEFHKFQVKTAQEKLLEIKKIDKILKKDNIFTCLYKD
ncbi:MAG: DNA-methyltransferase [Candidatus Gastranaerophilaceae bacterium]